jgi:predicted GNAT family N-acyltransferase
MDVQWAVSLTDANVSQLHELFQSEWWTKGRTLDDTRRMLAHSDYVFAASEPKTERLVGFARVLTDRTFKAFIFDVIVGPEHRGSGLGRLIVDRILEHPDLASVHHFELYCLPELVPFYERWGFSSDTGGITLLRRRRVA